MTAARPLSEVKAGLSKRTMREQIADKITAMIVSGLLRPDDELPSERDLAVTLDVSRETIRGALQYLAALGMVEIAHGSRSRVVDMARWATKPQRQDDVQRYTALEVHNARCLVEVAGVRTAALSITPSALGRLRHLVHQQTGMLNDPVSFQISDMEFHTTIYEASNNRLLTAFLTDIYGYALDMRRRALLVPNAVEKSLRDHEIILTAIGRADADGAAIAMSAHLTRVHRTTQASRRTATKKI
ncbi:FadR/GntR family transcriptional regulator [Acidisoma cladoniae]|jgi:DNA-binding FadR family transcriptional regulator|uniref:FadR/GntR family transcriptional regulator n=1 Tax=Acidisoma cladoniae TaxID=3040935 RepID=UPI00254E9EA3|nr:FCD domain-containing protein [Acidisoma sp. PAMC 29798]